MKSSEILRSLADMLDNLSGEKPTPSPTEQHLSNIKSAISDNSEKAEEAEENLGEFIPPLQQKLELLKKSVGVDNYYDEDTDGCACDELDLIKKNAGISPNTTAIMTLSDDEPMDN